MRLFFLYVPWQDAQVLLHSHLDKNVSCFLLTALNGDLLASDISLIEAKVTTQFPVMLEGDNTKSFLLIIPDEELAIPDCQCPGTSCVQQAPNKLSLESRC